MSRVVLLPVLSLVACASATLTPESTPAPSPAAASIGSVAAPAPAAASSEPVRAVEPPAEASLEVPSRVRIMAEGKDGTLLVMGEIRSLGRPTERGVRRQSAPLVLDAKRCVIETFRMPETDAWLSSIQGRDALPDPLSAPVRDELERLGALMLRFGARLADLNGQALLFGSEGRVAFDTFRASGWVQGGVTHPSKLHNLAVSPSGRRFVGTSCEGACDSSTLAAIEAGSTEPRTLDQGAIGEITFLDDDTVVYLTDNHVGAKEATRSCIRQYSFLTRRARDLRCFVGPQRVFTYFQLSPGRSHAAYQGSSGTEVVVTRILEWPSLRDVWSVPDGIGNYQVDDRGRLLFEDNGPPAATVLLGGKSSQQWENVAPVGFLSNGNVLVRNAVKATRLDEVRCELFREMTPAR